MKWEDFVGTSIFALIGYLIGSLSFAVIITRQVKKEDVRNLGSGNAGATNVVRNYGKKVGGVVFALDLLKPVVALCIAWSIREHSDSDLFAHSLVQAAGLFTIIGHIFPLYFKFKGGKGAAALAGFMSGIHWILLPIGIAAFLGIMYKTKKVSLGSMIAPIILLVVQIVFGQFSTMNESWSNPFTQDPEWWVNTIAITIGITIVIAGHRENIKRLIKGEERTIASEKPQQN